MVAEAVEQGQSCLPKEQGTAFEASYDEMAQQGLALTPALARPPGFSNLHCI